MKASLAVAHAKVLAQLAPLDDFERIGAFYSLIKETNDLERLLRAQLISTVKELRAEGALVAEIAERAGMDDATLLRWSSPATRG